MQPSVTKGWQKLINPSAAADAETNGGGGGGGDDASVAAEPVELKVVRSPEEEVIRQKQEKTSFPDLLANIRGLHEHYMTHPFSATGGGPVLTDTLAHQCTLPYTRSHFLYSHPHPPIIHPHPPQSYIHPLRT